MGTWKGWIYFTMDGKHEIPKSALPKRTLRGTAATLRPKAYTDPDPRIAAWRRLKRGTWSLNRKDRSNAVYYIIHKLMLEGMKDKEVYDIVDAVKNQQIADPAEK
jgi:hypothetical protein